MFYICSPYRGTDKEIERNIKYAQEITREMLLFPDCSICPITPHLYITKCLDDSIPAERQKGLEVALELLSKCEAVVVGQKYGISEGMAAEIAEANRKGIPVFYRD